MESNHLPKSIKWGNDNEPCARAAYTQYMRSNGHANLVTRPCGFIVHPSMGWLGASPDAVVTDPSVELQHGIAEFKCPYTKKDIPPDEACTDTNFYCTMIDNRLHKAQPYILPSSATTTVC